MTYKKNKTRIMERKVKHEIIKMLIPLIGTWWVIKRILPNLGDILWWGRIFLPRQKKENVITKTTLENG